MDMSTTKRRILILGGGFAGAYTAHHLEARLGRDSNVEVILVARENFVLFTPMLHEVAGSDVADTDIVQPLRKMLGHALESPRSIRSTWRRKRCGSCTTTYRSRMTSFTTSLSWRWAR
jgi:hypothetical protein